MRPRGRCDLLIMDSRLLWQTVSNAADKSAATQPVRSGDFLWLNPIAMSVVNFNKAEVVECSCLKPCWYGAGRIYLLMVGRIRVSRTFTAGQRSNQPKCQTPHYNKYNHQISPRCQTHCTTGHRGQLNTHYNQTTYPQLTYDMTTDYNKTDGLSPTTRKLTGHNSRKTQSPLSLRPPYTPTYTLPT